MSEAKHTPGPWVHNPRTTNIKCDAWNVGCVDEVSADGCGMSLCLVFADGDIETDGKEGTATANAQLIAAAPDLLEAAKTLIGFCSRRDGSLATCEDWIETFVEDGSTITECVVKAKAAINKAEGR